MKNKRYWAVFFLAIFMAVLSGCGRRQDNETNAPESNAHTTPALGLAQGGHTLTISTPIMSEPRLRQAGDMLQSHLLNQGITLDIAFEYYTFDEADSHYARMLSQLAAGAGPDIMMWGMSLPPVYRFVEGGYLADMYAIIDGSDTASLGDFFTNALTPFEVGGQLLVMPTQFSFSYVGINENVPPEFARQFADLTYATPSALMTLYTDLVAQHPDWGQYAFIYGADSYMFFLPELRQGTDFASRQVDVGHMAPLLTQLRDTFADNHRFDTGFDHFTDEFMATLQERYVFAVVNDPFDAMFDFQPLYFAEFVPIANERGQLVQRGFTGANISVTTQADPALAWALIEALLALDGSDENRFTAAAPITRGYFDQAVETGLLSQINHGQRRQPIGSLALAVENALARLYAYSQMPTAAPMDFLLPFSVGGQAFVEFLEGEDTAEAAILHIEAEVMAWLAADRDAVEAYVAAPTDTASLDLPVRTLTFHGSSTQVAVAQQAADAMNASWRAQGIPYVFELAPDSFPENVWNADEFEARFTRLSTQLMAGQGPDIFVYDRAYDIHALARSGFLMDFYTLMDNSPHTSRDDFFNRPLEAFEMYGGLYMFPTNFGFQYVAINTTLPQSIIDAYAAHEFITLAQMMEIYVQLLDNYPDEFGHMQFGLANSLGGNLGGLNVMASAMGSFIDFDARTSDLTNPNFISFLHDYLRVSEDQPHMMIAFGGFINPSSQREYIDSHAFIIHNWGGASGSDAHNFFTPYEPLFYYPRLLTSSDSSLILGTPLRGPIWSALGVTAAGDYELAWEFIQYLIHAQAQPQGRAAGQWGNSFGPHYFGAPILRSLFEDHTRRAFDLYLSSNFTNRANHQTRSEYVGLDSPAEEALQIAAAMTRLQAYNEMPMAMISPMIPTALFEDNMDLLVRGVITPLEFAQRVQNTVALWLIE